MEGHVTHLFHDMFFFLQTEKQIQSSGESNLFKSILIAMSRNLQSHVFSDAFLLGPSLPRICVVKRPHRDAKIQPKIIKVILPMLHYRALGYDALGCAVMRMAGQTPAQNMQSKIVCF